jgi:hypothetical protein
MFDDGRFEAKAKTDFPSPVDVALSFPSPGVIRIQSNALFADPEAVDCRRFLERAFALEQVGGATLNRDLAPAAELHFDIRRHSLREVLGQLADCLGAEVKPAADAPPAAGQSLILAPVVAPAITAGTGMWFQAFRLSPSGLVS